MPLSKVYYPVGAYSAQDKKEFAEKVTAMKPLARYGGEPADFTVGNGGAGLLLIVPQASVRREAYRHIFSHVTDVTILSPM